MPSPKKGSQWEETELLYEALLELEENWRSGRGLPGGIQRVPLFRQLEPGYALGLDKPVTAAAIHLRTNPPNIQQLGRTATSTFGSELRRVLGSFNEQFAGELQQRLQARLATAYTRSATGRFARGINVTPIHSQRANGESFISGVRVGFINYREAQFLTNLAGTGHFKSYPKEPYFIFAKGFEPAGVGITLSTSHRLSKKKYAALRKLGRSEAQVGRLKVPRRGTFFYAARPDPRGYEQRIARDRIGPIRGEAKSSFFFYPLFVKHPGWQRDELSEAVLDEGGHYQDEVISVFGKATQDSPFSFKRRKGGIKGPSDLKPGEARTAGKVVSDVIEAGSAGVTIYRGPKNLRKVNRSGQTVSRVVQDLMDREW